MNHRPIDEDDLFAPDPPPVEPAWVRSGRMRLASRSASTIIQDAMLNVTKDRCEAQLTKAALEHLSVLATMESQLSATTPQSTARYRAIVNAYTIRAVQRIARGGDDYDF